MSQGGRETGIEGGRDYTNVNILNEYHPVCTNPRPYAGGFVGCERTPL